jgi:hypothetical protein
VREESHLEDMRSAIRGDFERLAERRGGQELMRASEDEEPEPDSRQVADEQQVSDVRRPEPEAELASTVPAVETGEPDEEPAPHVSQAPDVPKEPAESAESAEPEPLQEPEEPPRRSFLDRLFGR